MPTTEQKGGSPRPERTEHADRPGKGQEQSPQIQSRRRFTKAGLATPVIMTLASRPVWATGGGQCHPSVWHSATHASIGPGGHPCDASYGYSPDDWAQRSNWPVNKKHNWNQLTGNSSIYFPNDEKVEDLFENPANTEARYFISALLNSYEHAGVYPMTPQEVANCSQGYLPASMNNVADVLLYFEATWTNY